MVCEGHQIPREDPQEREERKKIVASERKMRHISGPHPSRPTVRGPTLRRHVGLKRARPVQANLVSSSVGLKRCWVAAVPPPRSAGVDGVLKGGFNQLPLVQTPFEPFRRGPASSSHCSAPSRVNGGLKGERSSQSSRKLPSEPRLEERSN